MGIQVIRPAGAGHETAWVVVACALVVALAAGFVSLRTTAVPTAALAEHEVDARHDLTAAEQGLFADLRLAAEDIDHGDLPQVDELATLAVPPFVVDASSVRRGGHGWQRLDRGTYVGYLGISRDPSIAGSLLYVLNPHEDDGHAVQAESEPAVWLHRGETISAPHQLDSASLIRNGWKLIAVNFNAGVTRQLRSTTAR